MLNSLHRRLPVLVGLVISLLLLSGTALAVDTPLTGTITTADTAFTDCGILTNYAKVMPFTVTVTGTYTLDSAAPLTSFSGPDFYYVAIFSSAVSSAAPSPSRMAIINNTALYPSASVSLTAGTTYYLVVGGSAGCGSVYPVSYNFQVHGPGSLVFEQPPSPEEMPSPASPASFQPLRDGRLNGADHAAPVAVYPVDYGSGQIGLHVYDTATGVLLLEVTPELIAATDGVSQNTLIAEGAGVVVYRLADGTFYVGAPMANGKQYILTFDQLSATTASSSTEVE